MFQGNTQVAQLALVHIYIGARVRHIDGVTSGTDAIADRCAQCIEYSFEVMNI